MNKINLNETIQTIANVGVVAGLIFLGVEIRQNSVAIRANIAQGMATEQAELNRAFINQDIAEIFAQIDEDGLDSLSPVQRYQLNGFENNFLFVQQNLYYQYRSGGLDPSIWPSRHRAIVDTFRKENVVRHWHDRSFAFDDSFQEYINNVVLPEANGPQDESSN